MGVFLSAECPQNKGCVCLYVVYVCAVTCTQDIGCVCTCTCVYLTAACSQAKGCVCALLVHTCTWPPVCDCSTLAGYRACVCAEPCGACLCCGRGLEAAAWLTGLQRASDSRMGSKESQTIIPPLRAEPSCSTTVINGLSYPALTGGDQRLTHIGRERGAPGLRSWGDRQGPRQALLPAPCLPAAPAGPPQPTG